ncbi:hypothetical protein Ade02nite_59590 [Paractinoplanes deccanensis]|uniref:Uncharacterized protein n=1 Tax=Paractinoplanes deccanensis TaxID=113561 RepID=A0ABQ3YBB5_9ACTN|nr:hypothetical protein [Actinoplanes deccanensis]GID77318.1 hypothetical protein Ade02nite_59590 [Actinoplanes deccanensis]
MTGHLARLCLQGAGSTGHYTPHAFDLRLLGARQATDHIVYLHEVHHAGLNDVTAWGTALHVFARLPAAAAVFGRLLDGCRTVHESLATFASVQIATARHGALDDVLAAYPRYVPLYRATEALTTGVAGANRRQQIVTALARLCMQTPILDTVAEAGLGEFTMASVRSHDRPDARWNWFVRGGPGPVAAAAASADRVVTGEFGPAVLTSDGPGGDLYTATDRDHDAAWDRWELAAYDHLRDRLARTGAGTLDLTGHQRGTARLLELAQSRHGDLGLRAAMTAEQRRTDADIAAAVLQQVRHDFTGGERHRAVPLAASAPRAGEPVIVHARPPGRLAGLYRWPPGVQPPPVAVRVIVEDGDGPAVGHVPVADPVALGSALLCVGASCLADPGFAQRWFPAAARPAFVLVDIEPDRFVPRWAAEDTTVVAVPVRVSDTGGERTALLLRADDTGIWWLVVADDVTVRLMIEYLRGHLGDALVIDGGAFAAIAGPARAVITDVLATESFTSFDALGSSHAR